MYRAAAPQRAPPPAHSLSMEEEPDVSFSRAGEDEEQNPTATEKLAVSLPMHLPYVKSYHVADQLLRKVSSMPPAQGEDKTSIPREPTWVSVSNFSSR